MKSYYDLLGITSSATQGEVREAFLTKYLEVQALSQDKDPQRAKKAEKMLLLLQNIYYILIFRYPFLGV